jgi:putative ATP-dependent endonuclease of OLD family
LRRVDPEHIRYLRLTESRQSKITKIKLPEKNDEAHKFVREGVQAFPEIYFSRLVVLGEGDSEELVLPRILRAKGVPVDESAVTIAPLGGRHVNHFWRLLEVLEIPYITLLDLDTARHQGGWGRINYVNNQLRKLTSGNQLPSWEFYKWDDESKLIRTHNHYPETNGESSLFTALEDRNIFFSGPMDLDFSMLLAFPDAYGVRHETSDDSTIKSVLGKSHHDSSQYFEDELNIFGTYHKLFKLGSKPASHINALSQLTDESLLANMPDSYERLADKVINKLEELPE